MVAHLYAHMANTACLFSFPNFKRKKLFASGMLETRNNIPTVSSKFWQKRAEEWDKPLACQPSAIYSETCASVDPAQQLSVMSEFLQRWMMVQRLCFARMLLYLSHNAGNCWSSFLIYRGNIKWEHLLIHDSFITGLDSTLIMRRAVSVCSSL